MGLLTELVFCLLISPHDNPCTIHVVLCFGILSALVSVQFHGQYASNEQTYPPVTHHTVGKIDYCNKI